MTKVIFRKYRSDGAIIALFPNEIADHSGNVLSYMHLGQHSAANYTGCIRETVQTSASESKDLRRELEGCFNYNLT